MKKHLIAVLIVFSFLVKAGAAQSVPPLNTVTLPKSTIDQIKKNPQIVMERFLRMGFDQNPNGVFDLRKSINDKRIQVASARSRVLSNGLKYDFNGDMNIDSKEFEDWMKVGRPDQKAWLHSMLEFEDLNKDGDLSLDELQAYAEKSVAKISVRQPNNIEIMGFDVNGDKFITPQEIADVFQHILAGGDVIELPRNSAYNPPSASECNWPRPSENAIILFLNVGQGANLTNVTIAGQDKVTKISSLRIETGKEPLYLVSSTHSPIIWHVTGETERVERMVLGATQDLVGVAGLPADVLTFSPAPDCVPGHYATGDKRKSATAKKQLAALLGRKADWLISSTYLESIDLPSKTNWTSRAAPSGTTFTQGKSRYFITEDGPILLDGAQTDSDGNVSFKVYRDLKRFNPKGVTKLAPSTVVSPEKVEQYEILPEQPGVIQLIEQGAIRVTDDDYLFIQKPISRFPSGLFNPRSLRFILGDGIPLPKGSPGDSSVVSDKTGKCLVEKCFQAGKLPRLKLK